MKADTHVHTRFSDGRHSVEEVAAKAVEFGCEAIAITDHIDRLSRDEIPEYLATIDLARRQFPKLLVLVGVEWNVPPYGGDDHATVLFPDPIADVETVASFCELFDDHGRDVHDAARATRALKWLENLGDSNSDDVYPVVLLNHPTRKWHRSEEVYEFYRELSSASSVLVGFSGAPGHQAGKPLGAYEGPASLVDRWDPVVRTGDTWDRLLQSGIDVWGARAPSDFHFREGKNAADFWPGEFSETWIQVPDRTTSGVLRAIRAGSFFANHGGIIRRAKLRVRVDGAGRSAQPGEVLEVPAGSRVRVEFEADVPPTDLNGRANSLSAIELIIVEDDQVRAIALPGTDERKLTVSHDVAIRGGSAVFRVRGRRSIADGPDLMFHTNPVRVVAHN